jgi:hypothetical protein
MKIKTYRARVRLRADWAVGDFVSCDRMIGACRLISGIHEP